MSELLTLAGTTAFVFVIQQFLLWAFNKLKGNKKKKR
jgi:hypothetical protein